MDKIFNKSTRGIYGIMLGVLLTLLFFFQGLHYFTKKTFLFSNIVIFITLLALLLLFRISVLVFSKKRITMPFLVPYSKVVKIMAICLFSAQLYISYNILFYTGWDAGGIVDTAKALANNDISQINNIYSFATYPNNLLITNILAAILKFNNAVGIFDGHHQLMSIVFVNCILSTSACVLIYKILKIFVNETYAFLGFLLGIASFGLSPWMTICYSDALGIIFPVLLFYLYVKPVKNQKNRIINYALLILLASVSYSIKPQCIIMLIAIIIVEFFHSIKKNNHKKMLINIGIIGCTLICFLFVQKGLDKVYQAQGFVLNKEAEFGMSHFFMMGLNAERNGVFSSEDVSISASAPTAAKRREKNIEISLQRLKDFGIYGFTEHMAKKLLTIYNDGTFAWGIEGNFYREIYEEPNSLMAPFLRSIYYTNETGTRHNLFAAFQQMVWIFILMMCIAAAFYKFQGRPAKHITVLMLSIIGLTLFQALFEARARYLYIFVPVFCILAVLGIYNLKGQIAYILNFLQKRQ